MGLGIYSHYRALILRRRRRLFLFLAFLFSILARIAYTHLPPDSTLRLAVSFNAARASNFLRTRTGEDNEWLHSAQVYPGILGGLHGSDVAFLIKTGYGTRHRLPDQLKAYGMTGNMLSASSTPSSSSSSLPSAQDHVGRPPNFIVVGDWGTRPSHLDKSGGSSSHVAGQDVLNVDVVDAIKLVMEKKSLSKHKTHERFAKYRMLQAAIAAGNEAEALQLARKYGWELDALKFILGMELLIQKLPNHRWYVIMDDDTFFVKSSLRVILSRLDYLEPMYIGNAVGDYKGRFAHGGSGIIVSGEAMRLLFSQPHIVAQAYVDSLEEIWGDRLVATVFQKVGVYLDERFSPYFNGEHPNATKISAAKFCSPIASFHEVREPGAMLQLAHTLRDPETANAAAQALDSPEPWYLRWGSIWHLFGHLYFGDVFGDHEDDYDEISWTGRDHVGKTNEHTTTWTGVASDKACRHKCVQHGTQCIAWTFNSITRECHASPWMVVGSDQMDSSISTGIMWDQILPLVKKCGYL